jgi:hypothetical protein
MRNKKRLSLKNDEDIVFEYFRQEVLSEEFNACIGMAPQIKEIPIQLFDKQRRQWMSVPVMA